MEQRAVVGVGLEHHLDDARVLLRIPGQPDVHARLQQGAEGMRQPGREDAVDQALAVVCVVHRRAASSEERRLGNKCDRACRTTGGTYISTKNRNKLQPTETPPY